MTTAGLFRTKLASAIVLRFGVTLTRSMTRNTCGSLDNCDRILRYILVYLKWETLTNGNTVCSGGSAYRYMDLVTKVMERYSTLKEEP